MVHVLGIQPITSTTLSDACYGTQTIDPLLPVLMANPNSMQPLLPVWHKMYVKDTIDKIQQCIDACNVRNATMKFFWDLRLRAPLPSYMLLSL